MWWATLSFACSLALYPDLGDPECWAETEIAIQTPTEYKNTDWWGPLPNSEVTERLLNGTRHDQAKD